MNRQRLVKSAHSTWLSTMLCSVTLILVGCSFAEAQIRLPAIDPTGQSIFLPFPNSTEILSPFGNNSNQLPGPTLPTVPPGASPVVPTQPIIQQPGPVVPAFQTPADPAVCTDGSCGQPRHRRHLHQPGPVRQRLDKRRRGKHGEIIMTPSKIVAPVGSEVVVLAGICGEDGYYVKNQPLEWMLSQDSAGQIIEVGGTDHTLSNKLIPPSAEKKDGDYAWGRTLLKPRLISRGTPTPVDDIEVVEGQAWISLSSASEGTSYLTCVAPKAKAWDKRRASTIIHWVDANWLIPAPARATAGSVFPLSTNIIRSSDGSGVKDWTIRYEIIGGVPAEFAPEGTQSREVETGSQGQATVQIRQPAGQTVAGPTNIRVDVIRPAMFGGRELVLESGITQVFWSTPALTIRAIGPRSAGVDEPFEYRVEITNPGDQVARDVVVRSSDLSGDVQYISSNPKPNQFGNQYQWDLGEIAPGAQPKVINVQMRSAAQGTKRICFEVASSTDNLQTEACAETEIAAPCIGLQINGPTEARVGDTVNFDFQIVNQCNEPLEDVQMEIRFDDGLAAPGFPSPIAFGPVPSIEPGGSFPVPTLSFVAQQPGTRCFDILIAAKGGHTVAARRCIEISNVVESKIRISMESHKVVRVGDEILVRTVVDNLGNIPLEGLTLIQQYEADSMTPVRRSATPMRFIGDDEMAFEIGRLEPNSRHIIEVFFQAIGVDGNAIVKSVATNPLGQSDTTQVDIRIESVDSVIDPNLSGGPAGSGNGGNGGPIRVPADPNGLGQGGQPVAGGNLGVAVHSLNRTVRVGDIASFSVQVTNNASVSDENVKIELLVPTGAVLRDAGSNQSSLSIFNRSADGAFIELEPRRTLRPGESIDFTVTLEAVQAGQSTFSVNATSDKVVSPIEGKDTITIVQ